MKIALVFGGIFLIALLYNASPKIGAILLVIIVLGLWLTAGKKGMI